MVLVRTMPGMRMASARVRAIARRVLRGGEDRRDRRLRGSSCEATISASAPSAMSSGSRMARRVKTKKNGLRQRKRTQSGAGEWRGAGVECAGSALQQKRRTQRAMRPKTQTVRARAATRETPVKWKTRSSSSGPDRKRGGGVEVAGDSTSGRSGSGGWRRRRTSLRRCIWTSPSRGSGWGSRR